MEPRHPPVPYSATHAQSQSSGQSSPGETDCDSEYIEKDTHARKYSTRTDRGSRSTTGRAHDSVISPFSPKTSAPPSPSSSFSGSVGRKHRPVSGIQEVNDCNSHRVSYPPRAHLDAEKAQYYDSSQDHCSPNRASVPDTAAVVYDKSEYHEKGPEDKTWQLLVRVSLACSHPDIETDSYSSTSLHRARFSLSQSPCGPSSQSSSRLHSIPCASAPTGRRFPPSSQHSLRLH